MTNVGIIQARMGSTRLPGKMMLPLDNAHVIEHDVHRALQAEKLDEVVVATTNKKQDDILARYARRAGSTVFRGSEDDVLRRVYQAATKYDADNIVRITGDCPLLAPACIDTVVETLQQTNADYVSNIIGRTFPRGLDVEAFTLESFSRVADEATESHHREHVTPYYREQDNRFTTQNITSKEVFEDDRLYDRTDLRLTLDEADDYELLRRIYSDISFEDTLSIADAIAFVDEYDLADLNQSIEQKKVNDASSNSC